MKQAATFLLSIYFTIGSLFPLSDFSQLLQIPVLLDHYEQHQADSGNDSLLSLYEFLVSHFMINDDHEDPQHANLPLKSIDSSLVLISIDRGIELQMSSDIPVDTDFIYHLPRNREFNKNIFEPPL